MQISTVNLSILKQHILQIFILFTEKQASVHRTINIKRFLPRRPAFLVILHLSRVTPVLHTQLGRARHFHPAALHSGQHLLQVLHLQLPHPPVKCSEFREVCHLHGTDDWLRGDGLDDTHHHDIFACNKSSEWAIVH